jgi:hypothetical protein
MVRTRGNLADAQGGCLCRCRRRSPAKETVGQGSLPVCSPGIEQASWLTSISKAKALEGLGRLEEAQDAIEEGLQFEPDNQVLNLCSWEVS